MMRLLLVLGLICTTACSDDQGPSGSRDDRSDPPAGGTTDPGPKKPDPKAVRQDEGALSLLDRADAVSYSPLLAGLLDVTYHFRTSRQPKVAVEVSWVKPNHVGARLRLDGDATSETENWARTLGPQFVTEAKRLADLVVGTTNREQYVDDEIILEAADRVKIVARSERSLERSLLEAVITFGKDGLPTRMETKTLTASITLVPTHRLGPDGRWLVDKVDTRITSGGKKQSTVMSFEYQRVGPYTMPRKVTLDGSDGKVVQEYLEIRVDQGLSPEQVR